MNFVRIEAIGPGKVAGLFTAPGTGDAQAMFTIELSAKPGPLAALPIVGPRLGCKVLEHVRILGHAKSGRSILSLTHYRFKVDLIETRCLGLQQLRRYRWRMWCGSGLIAPVSAFANAKLVGAHMQMEQVPDQSGDFYLKVGCEKTGTGYQATCEIQTIPSNPS
jgi:hypothetical protein